MIAALCSRIVLSVLVGPLFDEPPHAGIASADPPPATRAPEASSSSRRERLRGSTRGGRLEGLALPHGHLAGGLGAARRARARGCAQRVLRLRADERRPRRGDLSLRGPAPLAV